MESANNELEVSVLSPANLSVLSERPSLAPMENEYESLQKKYEEAKQEIEELRNYKLRVEEGMSAGRVIPAGCRVVHMTENPYAEIIARKDRLHKLQEEKERASSDHPGSLAPPSKSLTDETPYKEECENLKKRLERMKELFTEKTNRFRDAV